jgi:hypothetical protein
MHRLLLALLMLMALPALAFDHKHAEWNSLLQRHVAWQPGGHESKVDYAAFKPERPAVQVYLARLSAVTPEEFAGWTRDQRLAFLINAYNAFTVELILTRYPDLKSIRDLGTVIHEGLMLNSPWKKSFFSLLGKEQTLDGIEHGMIRAPGVYDDPRVHMAVNCASIGCPALRPEAYTPDKLDAQLDDQVARFLADKTRNRYNPGRQALEVSKIFDWYGKDFARGYRGIGSLPDFFAGFAAQLADKPQDQAVVRERKAKIRFLDYDWALNDRKP